MKNEKLRMRKRLKARGEGKKVKGRNGRKKN
jgi:hypothetical protein